MITDPLLCEGYHCRRPRPVNLTDADLPIFENDLEYKVPAVRLKTLRKVEVSTQGRLFKNMLMLPDSFVVPQHRTLGVVARGTLHALKTRGRPDTIEDGTWISDNWSAEYYHWLCDALPRLFVAHRHNRALNPILPASHDRPYVRATLAALGIKAPMFLANDRATRVRLLHIPGHTALTGNVNPEIIRGIADVIVDAFGSQVEGRRRVYISRSLAPRRRIINEAQVVGVLERYGFETLHFENLAYEEQVRAMSETRFLVSIHGAGMANMMFMPRGSAVLELRKSGDSIHNCFFNLAGAVDARYFYQMCDSGNPDEPVWSADLIVDTERLEREVQAMLSVQAAG